MDRRRFLAGGSVGLGFSLAGCFGGTDDVEGHVRPDNDPEHVPSELVCEDPDSERHFRMVESEEDTHWGSDRDGHFALRANDLAFERGETVVVTLTNTSDEPRETGPRDTYGVQLDTDAGWQDVRVWEDGSEQGYEPVAVNHAPGEGFEWELDFTEEGLIEPGHLHEDRLAVCPDLKAGRYRFTFGMGERIAVAFDFHE